MEQQLVAPIFHFFRKQNSSKLKLLITAQLRKDIYQLDQLYFNGFLYFYIFSTYNRLQPVLYWLLSSGTSLHSMLVNTVATFKSTFIMKSLVFLSNRVYNFYCFLPIAQIKLN